MSGCSLSNCCDQPLHLDRELALHRDRKEQVDVGGRRAADDKLIAVSTAAIVIPAKAGTQ